MARIVFPITFSKWQKLFRKMKDKHAADVLAGGSIVTTFITEEGFTMADVVLDADNAKDEHELFEKLERDSEKFVKERDKLFNPTFSDHRAMVQYLKKLKRKNINTLGDWGVDVTGGKRIVYPVDFEGRYAKVSALVTQHKTFAADTSPLEPFLTENEIDIDDHQDAADDAKTNHDNFETANETKETKRADRDGHMVEVKDRTRGVGNFLVATLADNPNKAGDWGYTIDNSPKGSKVKTYTIGAGKTKTIANVVIGSIIQTGEEVPFQLYKGKTATGAVILLNPETTQEIPKGYSTLTLVNIGSVAGTVEVVVRKQ